MVTVCNCSLALERFLSKTQLRHNFFWAMIGCNFVLATLEDSENLFNVLFCNLKFYTTYMRNCDHGCIETEHMSITLYSICRGFANIITKYNFRQVCKLYESACCLGSIDCNGGDDLVAAGHCERDGDERVDKTHDTVVICWVAAVPTPGPRILKRRELACADNTQIATSCQD